MKKSKEKYHRLGEMLEKKRETLGFSQTEMAEKVGMKVQFYHNIEKGKAAIPAKDVLSFSKALSINPERLAWIINDIRTTSFYEEAGLT